MCNKTKMNSPPRRRSARVAGGRRTGSPKKNLRMKRRSSSSSSTDSSKSVDSQTKDLTVQQQQELSVNGLKAKANMMRSKNEPRRSNKAVPKNSPVMRGKNFSRQPMSRSFQTGTRVAERR
jgi:hypothetical protein